MKRTVLASALSFAVAFGATLPAYAQDVVINADGSVTVNTTPVPGETFTAQLANGQIVTLQAAPATTTTTTAAAGGGAAATGGTTVATVSTAGGLGGGVGLTALAALAAVGIVAAISSSSDTD